MDASAAGLGLQHGTVRLARTLPGWAAHADALRAEIRAALPDAVVAAEHVGSTAVPGLPAKPIIDLAVAVRRGTALEDVAEPMARLGWLFRGDADRDGGWLFVLEDAPSHRVAHAHGVEHEGEQWRQYVRFRDLLRSDVGARRTYELRKRQLAQRHPEDRRRYTEGKAETIQRLLSTERQR